MFSHPRFSGDQHDDLPADVMELSRAISQLSVPVQEILQPSLQQVIDSSKRRRRILRLVQESLNQLRLDMKYLVFDLEATRRERDTLSRGS